MVILVVIVLDGVGVRVVVIKEVEVIALIVTAAVIEVEVVDVAKEITIVAAAKHQ